MNSILQTPTPNIAASLAFYEQLNFKILSKKEKSTIVSDGKAIIEINSDRFARAGLKLFSADWSETVSQLEKIVDVLKIENGYLFSEPSGMWVYLITQNELPNYKTEESSTSVLGNFAGLSLETTAITKSLKIWNILGFDKTAGNLEHGWLSLANKAGFSVSLMIPNCCPHLFFNPSLSYFNGENNLAIIQNIRDLKIPITEEITHFNKENIVDNIIIRDPGGLGFFVYSD